MTSLRLRASLALVFAAFTAACGGGDGGSGPSFADSVSTADAEDAADGAASTATYLADNLNFGSPSIGATAQAMYTRLMDKPEVAAFRAQLPRGSSFGATAPSWQAVMRPAGLQLVDGCSFSGHGLEDFPDGPPIDANGNGIGDDAAIDVVCTYTEEAGGDTVYTLREEQHVTLKEITASIYGMNLHYEILYRVTNNHGYISEEKLEQSATIDLRSSNASTDQSMKYSGRYSEGDFEGAEHGAGAFGEEWGADFAAASPIVYGDPLPNGNLSLHGHSFAWEEPDGVNLSFTITTPTVLAYSASCAAVPTNPPFTGGVLHGALNNSSSQASFDVTFTSCGNYTIDVNGAYDEPVAVTARR